MKYDVVMFNAIKEFFEDDNWLCDDEVALDVLYIDSKNREYWTEEIMYINGCDVDIDTTRIASCFCEVYELSGDDYDDNILFNLLYDVVYDALYVYIDKKLNRKTFKINERLVTYEEFSFLHTRPSIITDTVEALTDNFYSFY
jgi:hypothetical protein